MSEEEIKQAMEMVLVERTERERKCNEELMEILKRYNCTFVVDAHNIGDLIAQYRIMIKSL